MLAPNGSNWLGIMPHEVEVINLNLSWEPKLNYPQKKNQGSVLNYFNLLLEKERRGQKYTTLLLAQNGRFL